MKSPIFSVFFLILWINGPAFAVRPDLKNLPIGLAPHEVEVLARESKAPQTGAPVGPVRSLAEWETSVGVMTLWTNPSLLRALAQHGPVKLLADSRGDEAWWRGFLSQNGIDPAAFSFFHVPTDSIWIRDYGPWFILDGNAQFGLVDTKYNRPRPKDDQVPLYIAQQLGVPFYQPGLVHTGGNYYNDALGNAFSSTLVYSENTSLSKAEVDSRMQEYLGIDRYTTSRLSPGITIEHIDTFGKLVAPDTWVFSEFPQGSPHKKDSEQMVDLLKTLKSPYGTPYKIFRMKMTNKGGDFRAYLNSFISNRALYFPAYGDAVDQTVQEIYQKALPSYDIVPVDAGGTTWGDSVHCRTRNILTNQTVFIFPTLQRTPSGVDLDVEVVPSPGANIVSEPVVHYSIDAGETQESKMQKSSGRFYHHSFSSLQRGNHLKLWLSAQDSAGFTKTEPHAAPHMQIEMTVE